MKKFENEFSIVECEETNGNLFVTFLGTKKQINTPAQLKSFLSLISVDLYNQIYDTYFNQFTM